MSMCVCVVVDGFCMRAGDVFYGVDVFGRGSFGGGGYHCGEAICALRPPLRQGERALGDTTPERRKEESMFSVALFAPGWVLETQVDQVTEGMSAVQRSVLFPPPDLLLPCLCHVLVVSLPCPCNVIDLSLSLSCPCPCPVLTVSPPATPPSSPHCSRK